jgi:hypothetical protein
VTTLLGRAPIETRRVQRLGREQMCRLLKPADGVPVNPLPQPPEQQVLDREHEHTTAAREFYGLSLVSRLQFLAGRLKRDLEAGQHPFAPGTLESECPDVRAGRTIPFGSNQ